MYKKQYHTLNSEWLKYCTWVSEVEKRNAGSDRKVSKHKCIHSLNRAGQQKGDWHYDHLLEKS